MYFTFDLYFIDNIKASRILQLVVLVLFAIQIILNPIRYKLRIFYNLNFLIFLVTILVSTIFYFFSGGYDEASKILNIKNNLSNDNAIKKIYFLPIREILVYLYCFFYYLILPNILIRHDEQIKYLFKVFFRVFFVSFLVGIIALIFSFYEIQLFSRQFNYSDGLYIGVRFHGLYGEPRDAAVVLIFSLALFNLRNIYFESSNSHFKYFPLILIMLIVTFSGSFVITLIGFLPLYFLFSKNKFQMLNLSLFIKSFLIILFIYILIISESRLMDYYNQIMLLPTLLADLDVLPWHISNQIINIYPLWLTYYKIIEFDIFSLLFGTGLGTVAIERYPHQVYQLASSHSQLTRLIFETGVIGFISWCSIFSFYLYKFRKLISDEKWSIMYTYFILLLSATLVHRSHLIYIYAGVLLSVYFVMKNKLSASK